MTKSGIHWGENAVFPYAVGDTTKSAEAARLVINALLGGLVVETVTLTGTTPVGYPNTSVLTAVSVKGLNRRLAAALAVQRSA